MTTNTNTEAENLRRKIAGIEDEIHSVRVLLNNAANGRMARSTGRLLGELDRKVAVKRSWERKLGALR